jgi:hypothetical protein
MITNVDLDLLEKTYQNAKMGITAIEAVLDKASDREFYSDLNKQLQDYKMIAGKSKQQLRKNGAHPKDNSLYKNIMLKSNIKMNTMINSDDSHIAQMVIQGSTMGVTQMTRLLHANEDADGVSAQIAKDFVKKEEDNINIMKNYL